MSILSDLRHAVRVLTKSPLFTFTSVLSLAVGIAATTGIFSLADALVLRPTAGVRDPDTVVDIGRTVRGEGFDNFGYPLFEQMRARSTTLDAIAATRMEPAVMSLGVDNSSERVYVSLVSGNYFQLLGTGVAVGRFFAPDEDRTAGTHPVVVMSHRYWTDRFNGDPQIVGRTLRLNGLPYTVVGVAEAGFTGTSVFDVNLWAPMAMEQHASSRDVSLLTNHNAVWMTAVGRLEAGATVGQAQQELDAITKTYLRDRGDERADRWGIAVARNERVPGPIRTPVVGFIAVLGALTGLVLLIACSNVAGMLLARALERRREVATRLAVGASRRRIITQLLIEGLVLAALAVTVSVPLTAALIGLLGAFQPDLPLPLLLDLRVDPRVIGFALALSVLTTMAFALVPALQSTRFELAAALHGANATADRRRAWLRHALVGGQVAMTLLLLVAAGLFMRSLQEAASIDAGFNVEAVDTIQVDTRLAGYSDRDGIRVAAELAERFRAAPGVTAVGASRQVPLQGGGLGLGALRAPGYTGPDGNDRVSADWDVVSPGYFEALQLPLVRGRAFSAADREGAPMVAIINERMAQQVWPGQDPIGRVLLQRVSDTEERPLQIVGIARQSKYRSLSESPRNFIYVPQAQQFMSEITFYVRRQPGGSQIASLRELVRAYNPLLPVIFGQTLEEATAVGLLPQRLAAWIAGSVGVIGLLLAALGLYGITAFAVAQRTREIAVRMALGATRESVLAMVLRQSGRLAAIGAAVGLALAVGVSMLIQSLLIGVQPVDPLAFGVAVAVLGVVLLLASLGPARHASRMDPMRALRAE